MTLSEKIISLVPEITELKFGCVVRLKNGQQATIVVYSNFGHFKIIDSSVDHIESDIEEILGRPITLADVLRAMSAKIGDDSSSYVISLAGRIGDAKEIWTYDKVTNWRDFWNLAADLDGQSEETKAFISKILGV